MKKWTILICVCMVALALAACGDNSSNQEPGNANENSDSSTNGEQKTVVFSTISGYYTTALKEVAKDYNKINPDTKVEINVIGDNDAYKTNFESKMAAGGENAPDIIHTNLVGDMSENVKKGYLATLNDFVKEKNSYNDGKTVLEGINSDYNFYSYDIAGNFVSLNFDLVGAGFYYNKDIFAELKLEVPKTWEELLEICGELEAAGYIPMAMEYPLENLLREAFVDWAGRPLYQDLLILPDDARYDESIHQRNLEIAEADPSNPNFDQGAIFDPEKVILASKNDLYNNQGEAEQKYWSTLQQLSDYYQPGYKTMDGNSVYSLFVSQEAAIYWNGSWKVGSILADMQKLEDEQFEWGTFQFPGFANKGDAFFDEPRGLLVPGHRLGITQKEDEEQMKRTKDFMKYLFSSEVAQKIYERTLEVGEFVQGPSLVEGVSLPQEINDYLVGFEVAGNMARALTDVTLTVPHNDESALNDAIFEFYDGEISVEEFLQKKANLVQKQIDSRVEENDYDLDPSTAP